MAHLLRLGVAHIRTDNAAYRRSGLAAVASTPAEMGTEIRRALECPRPRDGAHAALRSAAEAVLELRDAPVGARR